MGTYLQNSTLVVRDLIVQRPAGGNGNSDILLDQALGKLEIVGFNHDARKHAGLKQKLVPRHKT